MKNAKTFVIKHDLLYISMNIFFIFFYYNRNFVVLNNAHTTLGSLITKKSQFQLRVALVGIHFKFYISLLFQVP